MAGDLALLVVVGIFVAAFVSLVRMWYNISSVHGTNWNLINLMYEPDRRVYLRPLMVRSVLVLAAGGMWVFLMETGK